MGHTELGLVDVARLELRDELLRVQADAADQVERFVRRVALDPERRLDRARQAALAHAQHDALALGRQRELEQRRQVLVQHALAAVVDVLERMRGVGERLEAQQLDHRPELLHVRQALLHRLRPPRDVLGKVDLKDRVARRRFEQQVRRGHPGRSRRSRAFPLNRVSAATTLKR